MTELTRQQIIRQDFADNQIFVLIQDIDPSLKNINWNIEMIGNVREVICQ